jgi:choline dehydrogenase-like flavoprotein
MILDLNDPACPADLRADVCIIGAGAAGLALAAEFAGSALQVVILESGGWDHEVATQDLYQTIQTGMPFPSASGGRFRVLGGTTTRWGGQSLPLTPLDFELRNWVPHSGWPLEWKSLLPFYDRANRFLGVDTCDYHDETAELLGVKRPHMLGGLLDYHYSKWAPQPDLRRVYRGLLEKAQNIRVILHANVRDLKLGGNVVKSTRMSTLDGKEGTILASEFIIATGGLEVPRLLLASNRQRQNGLGNEQDLVGRFLQEHPAARLGCVKGDQPDRLQSLFNGRRLKGRRYSVRVSLTDQVQAAEGLLNASAGFLFWVPPDRGFGLIRRIIKREPQAFKETGITKVSKEILSSVPEILKASWLLGTEGRIYTPDATCEVAASFEQEPDPNSRVTLAEERDALGMPLAKIHWKLTPKTLHTARHFAGLIDRTLGDLGLGRLERSAWLIESSEAGDYQQHFYDQNHHMGTARMSVCSRDGVVDPHLRLHSIPNLHIASSAVFPTGGHSNPTLTLLALTIRLADQLKNRFS